MKTNTPNQHLTCSQTAMGLWIGTVLLIMVFGIVVGFFFAGATNDDATPTAEPTDLKRVETKIDNLQLDVTQIKERTQASGR